MAEPTPPVAAASSPPPPWSPTGRLFGDIGLAVLLAIGWSLAAQLFLLVRPLTGAVWLSGLLALFWAAYLRPRRQPPAGRAELLRLRAPSRALRELGRGLALTLLAGYLAVLVLRLLGADQPFPIPADEPSNIILMYLERPGGWAVFSLYAVVLAPLIEEYHLRGWAQGRLEVVMPGPAAVLTAAALFAAMHIWYGALALLLVPFVLGIVWGSRVRESGSLWIGVALHAAWNLLAMILYLLEPGLGRAA